MDLNIKNASEMIAPDKFSLLIYGGSGVGKTTTMAKLPDPVLILDAEGGSTSIIGAKGREKKGIHVLEIKDIQDLTNVYKFLKDDSGKSYKTVAIDSLTEIYNLLLTHIIKERTGGHVTLPEGSDWHETVTKFVAYLRYLRSLPIHLAATALAAPLEDSAEGLKAWRPMLPGKAPEIVQAAFDYVFYMSASVKEDKSIARSYRTEPSNRVFAKARIPESMTKLPSIIPSINIFLDFIEGKQQKKEEVKENDKG